MNRLDVRVLTDETSRRRVVVFQRCSGYYGFEEQQFQDGPSEFRWHTVGRCPENYDTAEAAVKGACARCAWLPTGDSGNTVPLLDGRPSQTA